MSGLADRLRQSLIGLSWGDYLTWAMMIGAFALMFFVMHRQHRMLIHYIEEPSAQMQSTLFSILKGRGTMILLLWVLLTGIVIAYDLRLGYDQPAASEDESAIAPAIPSLAGDVEALKPETAAAAPPLTHDEAVDGVKSFYEDAFVSFFYLTKCGAAQAGDDVRLSQGLAAELEALKARDEASKVLDAAKGSFQIIYSESSCDPASLSPVARDFKTLVNRLPQRLARMTPE